MRNAYLKQKKNIQYKLQLFTIRQRNSYFKYKLLNQHQSWNTYLTKYKFHA